MADRRSVLDPVIKKVYDADQEYQSYGTQLTGRDLPDFIFASSSDEHDPAKIFPAHTPRPIFLFFRQQLNLLAMLFWRRRRPVCRAWLPRKAA